MSFVKQHMLTGYLKSALEISESYKEEGLIVEEYDYYNQCSSIISSISKDDSNIRLFDYYFFQLNKSNDLPRDIKKLYKLLQVDSNELLLTVKELNSICLRFSVNGSVIPEDKISVVSVLVGFFMFLVYMFDLCTCNKKLYVQDLVCTYKELDNIISSAKKKISGFSSDLKSLLESSFSDKPLPKGMKRVISADLDLASFQQYKLKHDFILSQYLLKSLLKDECSYYSPRTTASSHILASLMNELRDNDYNQEFTIEFFSLLRKRAYLIPYNGICITPSKIQFSIDLYERQLNGDNYLILITNRENISYYTFINLNKLYVVNTSPWLYDLCNFLYSFYKLKEVARGMYGEKFASDPLLIINFKIDRFLAENVGITKGQSSVYDEFVVESPYYWRYKGNSRKKIGNKSFYEHNKGEGSFVYISAFKRRLPDGCKASDEAKSMSKLYCIELKEDETLVSPFIRGSR